MKIYVAGPWVKKQEASDVGKTLRSHGFSVVSRWHDNAYGEDSQIDDIMREEALNDHDDVAEANALVYLNLEMSEGKATELGMCLAWDIPIHVLGGKKNNVFLHLPWVNHHDSLGSVIRSLEDASRFD